jgi:hypothetical protein
MNRDALRDIMEHLCQRVALDAGTDVAVVFAAPSEAELVAGGLDAETVRHIRRAPWWDEMVAEVIETPELCDPDEPAERVLAYARDVVREYIYKRA